MTVATRVQHRQTNTNSQTVSWNVSLLRLHINNSTTLMFRHLYASAATARDHCPAVTTISLMMHVKHYFYTRKPRRHTAYTTNVPFMSLLTSKFFSFSFIIHFIPIMFSTSWAVSSHSLRLFTLLSYDYSWCFPQWPFTCKVSFKSVHSTKWRDIATCGISVNGRTAGRTTRIQ